MTHPVVDDHLVQRVELLGEQLKINKRVVELGRVLVRAEVETRPYILETLLHAEEVNVVRMPIGIVVDEVPEIREEDDVLVVPIVEEQLVVQTKLVLKEELHIKTSTNSVPVRRVIPLRSEHATVTRLDEPGLDTAILYEGDPR